MSLFRVKLQNLLQGRLDMNPATHPLVAGTTAQYGNLGSPQATSIQRQVFVAGPGRKYRLLKDGDTFSDCNYWKQFAYPQCTLEKAFIDVITDDNSVWSDVAEENTFGVGGTLTLATDYSAANTISFTTTNGGPARFLMLLNQSSGTTTVELNGDTNLTFTMATATTLVFDYNNLMISQLRVKGTAGQTLTYMASVRSNPTS